MKAKKTQVNMFLVLSVLILVMVGIKLMCEHLYPSRFADDNGGFTISALIIAAGLALIPTKGGRIEL